MTTFWGLEIVQSNDAVRREEDWSDCRSPSRARRRRKQGHRQNVIVITTPCAFQIGPTVLMHPTLYAELKRQLSRDAQFVWGGKP